MARLFITPREIQFINDLTKEYLKDTVGQKIYYFAISTKKTQIHEVYEEAPEKIFEKPIEIPAQVGQTEWSSTRTAFGPENTAQLEVFLHGRDLIDKNLIVSEGDYFTYGDSVYEIVKCIPLKNIFGQEEYNVSFSIVGKLARIGEFDPKIFFPPYKDENKPYDQSKVQKEFVQQRGLKNNQEGATGDIRQIRSRLKEDLAPIALGEGPRVVDLKDTTPDDADRKKASSFNNQSTPPDPNFYDE
jgi:hypothetical protein